MSYRTALDEARRLVILQLLAKTPSYIVAEHIFYTELPNFGQEVSLAQVQADLDWLNSKGLVTLTRPGGVTLAKLTQWGLDVAKGRAVEPGVKQIGPEE
jgi:Fe2+ or Zn2+ uptake regulation protein